MGWRLLLESTKCPEHDHINGMECPAGKNKGSDLLYHLPRTVWQWWNWGIESSTNQWESTSTSIYIYVKLLCIYLQCIDMFYWRMIVICYLMIPQSGKPTPSFPKPLFVSLPSSSPSRRCAATPCGIFGANLHRARDIWDHSGRPGTILEISMPEILKSHETSMTSHCHNRYTYV